jgi:hypothetical protein
MTRRWFAIVGGAVLAIAVFPREAFAWTPATHIFLGESVLSNLEQLPTTVAALLRSFPYDFLYGSIAADTSMAKKYAPVGRHCHSWHVGQEIYDQALSDPLKAFGLGYLAHLAADTVAHNYFVPRQLVVTSRTIALGHSYWESRFETQLGPQYAATAMDVIRLGHGAADAHLDQILAPTVFSVRTSRRLFRGMVGVTETQSWQRIVRAADKKSRWNIADDDMERYMGSAFQYVMELLGVEEHPAPRRLDPSGEGSLRLAKRMRLDVVKGIVSPPLLQLAHMADEHFAVPSTPVPYWEISQSHRPWHGNGSAAERKNGQVDKRGK